MMAQVRVPNSYTWALFILLLQHGNWPIVLGKASTSSIHPPRFPWNGSSGTTSTPTSIRTDHPWTWRGGSQEDSSTKGESVSDTESSSTTTTLESIADADLDKYIDFLLASVKDEIDENQNPLLTLVQQAQDEELLSAKMIENSEPAHPKDTSLDEQPVVVEPPQDTDMVGDSLANVSMVDPVLPESVEETAVVQEEEVVVSIPEVESETSTVVEDSVTLGNTSKEVLTDDQSEDSEIVPSEANVTTEEDKEEEVESSTDSIQLQPDPLDTNNETSVPSDDLANLDWINSALETPPPEDSGTIPSVGATGDTRMVCDGTVCRLVSDEEVESIVEDDVALSSPMDKEEEVPSNETTTVAGDQVLEESTSVANVFAEDEQHDASSATQEITETVVAKEEVVEDTIATQVDIHASTATQQDGQLTNATLNTTEMDQLNQNQTETADDKGDNSVPPVSFWGGIRRSWGLMTAGALGIPTGNLTLDPPPKQANDTIPIESDGSVHESVEQLAIEVEVKVTNVSIIAEVETEQPEEVSPSLVISDESPTESHETLLEPPIETDTRMKDEPNDIVDFLTDDDLESLEDDFEDEYEDESREITNTLPPTNSFVYRFLLSRGLYRPAMFLALCEEWTKEYVVPCVDSSPLNGRLELELLVSKLSYLAIRGGASASPVIQAVPKVAPTSGSINEASGQNSTQSPETVPAVTTGKVRPNLIYRYLLGFEPYGHVAVMESVLLHEWTRVYIPMFESAMSALYHRFFPDASRRSDFDDFGDSHISGFVSADGKAARGGKRRRELAKQADQNSLYQLQSLGDLSVARFTLVSKSFLKRHGLGEGQISVEEIPTKPSNTRSTRASSSSRTTPKPKAGIEITFGLKTPSSDEAPARRTRRKRREKEPDSIMTRIRSATEGNFVRSSILGAYPGDARRVSDAASTSGLYDLAKKYGYEDSDTEKLGASGSKGSSRRKSSSQRRKNQEKLQTTPRRKRTKSSNADLDNWDKSVSSSLPSRPKQPDTSVLGKTSSILQAGRIEVEKRSKDRKK